MRGPTNGGRSQGGIDTRNDIDRELVANETLLYHPITRRTSSGHRATTYPRSALTPGQIP
jgi:hypothetical protein